MRINQVRFSKSVVFFEQKFIWKYRLTQYSTPHQPALFFGCYRDEDIEAIAKHQSLSVIIWGGSDAMNSKRLKEIHNLERTEKNPIHHIAISNFIARDLNNLSIAYARRNIFLINPDDFNPFPLGDKVYVYGGPQSGIRAKFYGLDTLNKIKEQLPQTKFIVCYSSPPSIPHSHIYKAYQQCCLGLRLTKHDGCSSTVVELGLMGRKCVWNGDLPNAISWNDTNCIVSAIKRELGFRGTTNIKLAVEVRSAIAQEDWLYTETYDYSS